MNKDLVFSVSLMFVCFILFEIGLYISMKEKITNLEYQIKTTNIEVEELRKTQRLISQDVDFALHLAVESAGGTDEN